MHPKAWGPGATDRQTDNLAQQADGSGAEATDRPTDNGAEKGDRQVVGGDRQPDNWARHQLWGRCV